MANEKKKTSFEPIATQKFQLLGFFSHKQTKSTNAPSCDNFKDSFIFVRVFNSYEALVGLQHSVTTKFLEAEEDFKLLFFFCT